MSVTARQILAARMATWRTTPVCWPNTPPLTNLNKPWVRFNVIDATPTIQNTFDLPYQLTRGFVAIQVFTPAGSGDGTAWALANQVKALFDAFESGNLACEICEIKTVGTADGWYQLNVSCRWILAE